MSKLVIANFVTSLLTMCLAIVALSGTSSAPAIVQDTAWLQGSSKYVAPIVGEIDVFLSFNLQSVHVKETDNLGVHVDQTFDLTANTALTDGNWETTQRTLFATVILGGIAGILQFFAATALLCMKGERRGAPALATVFFAFFAWIFMLIAWAVYIDQVAQPGNNGQRTITLPIASLVLDVHYGDGLGSAIAGSWFAFISMFTAGCALRTDIWSLRTDAGTATRFLDAA